MEKLISFANNVINREIGVEFSGKVDVSGARSVVKIFAIMVLLEVEQGRR